MKRLMRNLLFFILCLSMLLTCIGCGGADSAEEIDASPTPTGIGSPVYDIRSGTNQIDDKFTLTYSKDHTFNPITGTNVYNMAVSSFVYEGLFALDKDLKAQKVLCEHYSTTDGITYNITIIPNVTFHNGEDLTADDVAYSLSLARDVGNYVDRLGCIEEIIVTGTRGMQIILDQPNYRLPELLDVPIIPDGTIDEDKPAGTGQYQFTSAMSLKAYDKYRSRPAPLPAISLVSISTEKMTDSFSSQDIDLLPADLTSFDALKLNIDHETHYYNTTVLQYLVINMNSSNPLLQDRKFRQALSAAIDRDALVSNVMEGWGISAPLILNPSLEYYNETWERNAGYAPERVTSLFRSIGLKDLDRDGFLDYPASPSTTTTIVNEEGKTETIVTPTASLTILVNEENKFKVAAADAIVSALQDVGINTSLRTLPWDEYLKALQEGDYDIFYGETRFFPNFDFTELLSSEGSLNYGNYYDEKYIELVDNFLGASSDTEIAAAASALCNQVNQNCHIIPLLYKQNAVLTHRGIVSGIVPSQSTATGDLSDWTVSFDS